MLRFSPVSDQILQYDIIQTKAMSSMKSANTRSVMKPANSSRTIVVWILACIAVIFGVLTIISGGQVLFGGSSSQQSAGNYVLFVVWFNFLAGFVYLVAGSGIWMRQGWAVWLSLVIAIATIIVFAAFGMHIYNGGGYETRTVGAMSLRSVVWIFIFVLSYRELFRPKNG